MSSREDRNPPVEMGTRVIQKQAKGGWRRTGIVVGRGTLGDPYVICTFGDETKEHTMPRWALEFVKEDGD